MEIRVFVLFRTERIWYREIQGNFNYRVIKNAFVEIPFCLRSRGISIIPSHGDEVCRVASRRQNSNQPGQYASRNFRPEMNSQSVPAVVGSCFIACEIILLTITIRIPHGSAVRR